MFQKFMPSSGLLLSFSAVLSTLDALLCSVLCAGLGPGFAPVMVAAMAIVVQDLPSSIVLTIGRESLFYGSSSRMQKGFVSVL